MGRVYARSTVKELVFFCALSYLVFGLGYAYITSKFALLAYVVLPVALGIVLAMSQNTRSLPSPEKISDEFTLNIAIISLALIGLAYSSYLLVPAGYFGMDKVERASHVSFLYPFRIGLFASIVPLTATCIHAKDATSAGVKLIIHSCFFLILIFGIIELNREVFICLGISWFFIKQYSNRPLRLVQISVFFLFALLAMFMFKYAAYLLVFGAEYDGGIIAIGELVNWARWTVLVLENDYSVAELQRNDLIYLLQSIVYPFGLVSSSSEILFSEILGRSGRGESYGYSGPLWTFRYGFVGSFFLWTLVFSVYIHLEKSKKFVSTIIILSLSMVLYRFFRSEWPLVFKTLLWTYLYPSLFICSIAGISCTYRKSGSYKSQTAC